MLPELSHLQFLVLTALLDGEQSGRAVREHLAERGVNKSGPAFYQLMARLEDAKLVAGRYEQKRLSTARLAKERRYEITGEGIRAVEATEAFYAELARPRA